MDFLILIKNGCDNVTAMAAPSLDSLGCIWCWPRHDNAGMVRRSRGTSSAQGGPGFNIAKFISFFILITFAYCFVRACY